MKLYELLKDGWINPFDIDLGIVDSGEVISGKYPTGSFYTVYPQITDTDKDFVLLVTGMEAADILLLASGYRNTSSQAEEGYDTDEIMQCYRREDINLIVTDDEEFFKKWVKATRLAKSLNLHTKDQRITLFRFVLYEDLEA